MYWHPKQTVECDQCRGDGKDARSIWNCAKTKLGPDCPYCKNGRIPRPFMATAQPLTKVILTTMPEDGNWSIAVGRDGTWISPRWPGIQFEVQAGVMANA